MKSKGMFLFIATCAGGLLCAVAGSAVAQMPVDEAANSAADAKLEKRIDYRLQRDARLKARNVDASVSDGIVTLTGTVRTPAEKERAERLARTKGVTDVDNQIELQGKERQMATPPSPLSPAPQGAEEPGAPPPSEAQGQQQGQQGQAPSEGAVRERTTRVEERTETRTERAPQSGQEEQQQQQQQGTGGPAMQNVPQPAQPAQPSPPAPAQQPSAPQQ